MKRVFLSLLVVLLSAKGFAEFSLAPPAPITVVQGEHATQALSLMAAPPQSAVLSAHGLPAGVTLTFSPSSCVPPCAATVMVSTAPETVPGAYQVEITGTDGVAQHTTVLPLTVEPAKPQKKWAPGHYVALGYASVPLKAEYLRYLALSGVSGVVVYIQWKFLEPARDVYDFTVVQQLLDLVQSYNKYLIVQFMSACWNCQAGDAFPQYLIDSGLVVSFYNTNNYTAKIWNSAVIARMLKIFTEMGKRYDAHPNLIGVRDDGSATPGVSGLTLLQRQAAMNALTAGMAAALPKTLWFKGVDWLGGEQSGEYLSPVVDFAREQAAGINWPDTIPTRCPNHQTNGVPEMIAALGNELPKNGSLQLAGGLKYCSPAPTAEELYNYAVGALGVHYLVWIPWSRSPTYDFWADAVPFIAAHPQATTDCPKNIRCLAGAW